MENNFERDFKGIWIPKQIWNDKNLTALDKMILMEIDSLDSSDEGCYASNEYLSNFCNCTETKVSTSISKLIKIGYLEVSKFDGRKRYLKSRLSKNERQTLKNLKADFKKNKDIYNNKNNNINIKESIKEKYFENEELNNIFHEFIEMRKKLKAINSERAINSLLKILEPYDDETKILIIEQSIVNSWKGLFKLKTNKEIKEERKWWERD